MVSTMKEDDKKKKKGMVVVIALGGKPPKSPEHTADPDDKKKAVPMSDAWRFLKMKETTKTGQPFSNRIARMRAGKEAHEQTRMQMGDLEDPTADKEIKPPRIDAEVPAGSNYQGNTKEEVESFEHGVPMMQMIEEERRRKEAAKPKNQLTDLYDSVFNQIPPRDNRGQ